MRRFITVMVCVFTLSITHTMGQMRSEIIAEESGKKFITKMYNENLYEDYDFLREHCSPELLKKLQDAYTYDTDTVAYATWLFRSGQQDEKSSQDNTTTLLEVTFNGDWYTYKALDMGWEFTRRIKLISKGGLIIIEDLEF